MTMPVRTIDTRVADAWGAERTRTWLAAGAAAGPLFVIVVLIQAYTRAGFDPRRHPLSLLALGEAGWIQTANFVIAAALVLTGAYGMRLALHGGRAGNWGPILVGLHGAAWVWGAVFPADPAYGYPSGATSQAMSWHGILHQIAPPVASAALIAACVVFARRFAGRREWAWTAYCALTPVASLALSGLGFAAADFRLVLASGAVLWLWVSAICLRLAASRTTLGR